VAIQPVLPPLITLGVRARAALGLDIANTTICLLLLVVTLEVHLALGDRLNPVLASVGLMPIAPRLYILNTLE
jgi:hypothetical protein